MRRLFSFLIALLLAAVPTFAEEGGAATIYRKGSAVGKIALTFDDGPHPTYTQEILSILKEYGVRATFFVVGENARSYPTLVQQIADEGHEIGNHTDSHAFLRDLTLASMCKEVTAASDTIEEITGTRPHLFRPPGGSYSDSKVQTLADMGYVSVLWSKDTRDWTCPGVDQVISAALENVGDGEIILFHDFNGRSSPTPAALRAIIPELLSRGYSLVTVSELL